MTPAKHRADDPADELRHDRKAERRLTWKAGGALVVVVAYAVLRHRYLL
jgi:hypothetical protein